MRIAFPVMILVAVIALVGGLSFVALSQSQTPTLGYIKQFDEHTHIITINGQEFAATDLTRTKEIKANELKLAELQTVEIPKLNEIVSRDESDIAKEKQNTIDERVRSSKFETMYSDQVKLSGQCFDLLKRGGGKVGRLLDNPFFRIGEDATKTAIQMRRCR